MPAFPQVSDEMLALIRSHVRDKRGHDVIAAVRAEMALMGEGVLSYPTLDKDGKSQRPQPSGETSADGEGAAWRYAGT